MGFSLFCGLLGVGGLSHSVFVRKVNSFSRVEDIWK